MTNFVCGQTNIQTINGLSTQSHGTERNENRGESAGGILGGIRGTQQVHLFRIEGEEGGL